MKAKITQVAVALGAADGVEIQVIVAVDDQGRAWKLSHSRSQPNWIRLPELPDESLGSKGDKAKVL